MDVGIHISELWEIYAGSLNSIAILCLRMMLFVVFLRYLVIL